MATVSFSLDGSQITFKRQRMTALNFNPRIFVAVLDGTTEITARQGVIWGQTIIYLVATATGFITGLAAYDRIQGGQPLIYGEPRLGLNQWLRQSDLIAITKLDWARL